MTPPRSLTAPCWPTSSFGGSTGTSSIELSSLEEHLTLCQGLRGPLFTLRCQAEVLHDLVVGRFMTTVVVTALLIGASLLVS